MPNISKCAAPVAIALMVFGGTVKADEEMERILNEVAQFMHHSCASVTSDFGDDEEKVAEIVRLMAAVSLFNRAVDVEQLFPEEAARDALKGKFTESLKAACTSDPDALLAGAVDAAVKDAVQ